MRAQILWRNVHSWVSIGVALPLLIVICTGLLLQVKKSLPWIQPREHRGSGGPPRMPFDQILLVCAAIPAVDIQSWEDVHRLDYRPDKGLLKVSTEQGWEVQIDPVDGRVLQVARRRSDLIEALHDGSWFGSAVKSWIFLPAGLALALLWATGLYLFLLPRWKRWRARKAAQPEN